MILDKLEFEILKESKLSEYVDGNLDISNLRYKSLKDCPSVINGDFDCSDNRLTSLKGCPSVINGNFDCRDNLLASLKYGPTKIKKTFFCANNNLSLSEILKYLLNTEIRGIISDFNDKKIMKWYKIEDHHEKLKMIFTAFADL